MSCHGQDISFEVNFSAVSTTVWWVLFASATTVWLYHRHNHAKSTRLYHFLYGVITLNAIAEAVYLAWITHIARGGSATGTYYFFIFMDKLALSSFVALMLVCAAGFCITRDDLGPHSFRVVSTPIIWLITGWITGFVWYATQASPDDWCTTTLKQMSDWQATVWFVCSVINLATYLMAWIYIFSIMGEEMEMLEMAEKALLDKAAADGRPVQVNSEASERIVKSLLGPNGNSSLMIEPPQAAPEADLEAAAELETFAGRVDFMVKKKLLYRFALGCGAYLFALICVLLIPIFNVDVLETTLYSLEALVKWVFMGSLIYILRPTVTNPYLSLDLTTDGDINTQLAFYDDESDSESAPRPPTTTTAATTTATTRGPNGAATSAGAPPSSTAAARAQRKSPKDLSDVPLGDVRNGRDQGGRLSPQVSVEEHKKKFSLEEDEEPMQDMELGKK